MSRLNTELCNDCKSEDFVQKIESCQINYKCDNTVLSIYSVRAGLSESTETTKTTVGGLVGLTRFTISTVVCKFTVINYNEKYFIR